MVKNSELLSKLDPEVVRKFEEKQVRYFRYMPDKSNNKYLSWQHVYNTDDREVSRHIFSRPSPRTQALHRLSFYNGATLVVLGHPDLRFTYTFRGVSRASDKARPV